MDDKTKGIVATIAAIVLCGCPGLFMCFFGATSILASQVPGAEIDVMGNSDPASAMTDRKSTRLNSSHAIPSRIPSSA